MSRIAMARRGQRAYVILVVLCLLATTLVSSYDMYLVVSLLSR
jgi:hypothetical protein